MPAHAVPTQWVGPLFPYRNCCPVMHSPCLPEQVVTCLFTHFRFMGIQESIEYLGSVDFFKIHSQVAQSFLREPSLVQSWQRMPSAKCSLSLVFCTLVSVTLHTCSLLVSAPDILLYPFWDVTSSVFPAASLFSLYWFCSWLKG